MPADMSPTGIEALLTTNNRDMTGQAIPELGFSLAVWNGKSASLSAALGAFSPQIGNFVLLSFHGPNPLKAAAWAQLIERAVEAFDPDSAVVTNNEFLERHGNGTPDEAGGWFVYRRGAPIAESYFP